MDEINISLMVDKIKEERMSQFDEYLTAPSRSVPVLAKADVLVAGCGSGGFIAALASARNGAKTILIERNAFPGGVSTAGLMQSVTNHIMVKDEEGNLLQSIASIPTEYLDRLVEEGGMMPHYLRNGQPQIPNDPEIAKRVMITILREANVQTIYSAFVSQVIMADDEERIHSVIIEGKGGPYAIIADQYIDATGDLDLFALPGALESIEAPVEERTTFSSFLYNMANVDIDKIIDWFEANPDSYNPQKDIPTTLEDTIKNWREFGVFHLPHFMGKDIKIISEAIKEGNFPENFGKHTTSLWALGMFACRANHGNVLINSNAFRGNDLDIIRKSECEEEGRLSSKLVADFLVKNFPGFENSWLDFTATEIGSRWTRRLKARHFLTNKEFDDGLVHFNDVIGCSGAVISTTSIRRRLTHPGEIPFRSLVCDGPASNVILATGKGHPVENTENIRGQITCMVLGQAAGTAAALANKEGVPVNSVNIKNLQKALYNQGTFLGYRWIHKNIKTIPGIAYRYAKTVFDQRGEMNITENNIITVKTKFGLDSPMLFDTPIVELIEYILEKKIFLKINQKESIVILHCSDPDVENVKVEEISMGITKDLADYLKEFKGKILRIVYWDDYTNEAYDEDPNILPKLYLRILDNYFD